jgi:hypothetical protein
MNLVMNMQIIRLLGVHRISPDLHQKVVKMNRILHLKQENQQMMIRTLHGEISTMMKQTGPFRNFLKLVEIGDLSLLTE